MQTGQQRPCEEIVHRRCDVASKFGCLLPSCDVIAVLLRQISDSISSASEPVRTNDTGQFACLDSVDDVVDSVKPCCLHIMDSKTSHRRLPWAIPNLDVRTFVVTSSQLELISRCFSATDVLHGGSSAGICPTKD